ncbi:MAG: DUF1559 domain-containing protein [Planctomycetaceae bacterium]
MFRNLIAFVCLVSLALLTGCSSEPDSATPPVSEAEESAETREMNAPADVSAIAAPEPQAETATANSAVVIEGKTLTLNMNEQSVMGLQGMGMIDSQNEEGVLSIANWADPPVGAEPELDKEYFLLAASRSGTGFVSKGVFEKLPDNSVSAFKLDQKLDDLTGISHVIIFRPNDVSDEFIKNFQGNFSINASGKSETTAEELSAEELSRRAATQSETRNRMKMLGLAFHNYHDIHQCFPPGVIYGPDGKPWHSWRTLLLPYLEKQNLYEMYDFTQPWDSEDNIALLNQIGDVYQNLVYENADTSYTHFAAVVGKKAALIDAEFDGTTSGFEASLNRGFGLRDMLDGTSNTLLMGTVSPEAKIYWSEPRDLFINSRVAALDEEGGFSTINYGNGESLMALFCDGSIQTFTKDRLDKTLLEKLVTASGGELIQPSEPQAPPRKLLKIKADGENSSAEVVSE